MDCGYTSNTILLCLEFRLKLRFEFMPQETVKICIMNGMGTKLFSLTKTYRHFHISTWLRKMKHLNTTCERGIESTNQFSGKR